MPRATFKSTSYLDRGGAGLGDPDSGGHVRDEGDQVVRRGVLPGKEGGSQCATILWAKAVQLFDSAA